MPLSYNFNGNDVFQWTRNSCKDYTLENLSVNATLTVAVTELTTNQEFTESVILTSGSSTALEVPRDGIYRICSTYESDAYTYTITFEGYERISLLKLFENGVDVLSMDVLIESNADMNIWVQGWLQTWLDANGGGTATYIYTNPGINGVITIQGSMNANLESLLILNYDPEVEVSINIVEAIGASTFTYCDFLIEGCGMFDCIEELFARAHCLDAEIDPCCQGCRNEEAETIKAAKDQLNWFVTNAFMAFMPLMQARWANMGLPTQDVEGIQASIVTAWEMMTNYVMLCGVCPEPATTTSDCSPCNS